MCMPGHTWTVLLLQAYCRTARTSITSGTVIIAVGEQELQWLCMLLQVCCHMLTYACGFWLLCRSYYADAGWEDGLPSWALAKEKAADESGSREGPVSKYRKPPHTYSVRPYQHAIEQEPAHRQSGS